MSVTRVYSVRTLYSTNDGPNWISRGRSASSILFYGAKLESFIRHMGSRSLRSANDYYRRLYLSYANKRVVEER
jgi:hypothetical protein